MLKYFVISAFAVLAVLLVGCGDDLNPLDGSSPGAKIEIKEVTAGKMDATFLYFVPPFPKDKVFEYVVSFLISFTNLSDREVIVSEYSFSLEDRKGAAIYSSRKVYVGDPSTVPLGDLNTPLAVFSVKPKTTESIVLFVDFMSSLDGRGKWYLVYEDVVIPVQGMIDRALASCKEFGNSTGDQPVDEPSDGKDSTGNVGNQSNPPKEITSPDGAQIVLIPAGEFQMGSNDGDEDDDERPVHTVHLDAFYMDKYEVTRGQYKKFLDATGYIGELHLPWNDENAWCSGFLSTVVGDLVSKCPVVLVSWCDAKAYADWAGKRLPTEAEWEKAARGGLIGKRYPWGDDDDHNNANWAVIGGEDYFEFLGPVGSFNPNGYGLYDMAGNASEWCADWYAADYYATSPKQNPVGPNSGLNRVMRDGSWNHSYVSVADRHSADPHKGFIDLGFRCAMDAK